MRIIIWFIISSLNDSVISYILLPICYLTIEFKSYASYYYFLTWRVEFNVNYIPEVILSVDHSQVKNLHFMEN